MTKKITIAGIVKHAIAACRCFSEYEKRFFNFPKRPGWAGWEDWLTVEVLRRINSPRAIAFASYPNSAENLDIFIDREKIAVEIKVTYINNSEVKKWIKKGSHRLTSRVSDDAQKLERLPSETTKLLLLAAVFESHDLPKHYTELVEHDITKTYANFHSRKWFNCSSGDGCILLLVMASSGRLPSDEVFQPA